MRLSGLGCGSEAGDFLRVAAATQYTPKADQGYPRIVSSSVSLIVPMLDYRRDEKKGRSLIGCGPNPDL